MGRKPPSRIDNFPETLLQKFIEIGDIAKKYEVDAIVQVGDLFDSPDTSDSVAGKFAEVIARWNRFTQVLGIGGNHDEWGMNEFTLPKTKLGLFSSAGLVQFLGAEPVALEKDGAKLLITGSHYRYDIDRSEGRWVYEVPHVGDGVHLHVVHGMLTPKPLFGAGFTLIDEINPNADILLCGHLHDGWRETLRNNTICINPGAVARIEGSAANLKRIVQVVLIEVFSDGEIKTKYIPLSTALSGEEVIDRTKIEKEKAETEAFQAFLSGLSEKVQATDLDEIFQAVADEEGLSPELRERALTILGEAQSQVSEEEEDVLSEDMPA